MTFVAHVGRAMLAHLSAGRAACAMPRVARARSRATAAAGARLTVALLACLAVSPRAAAGDVRGSILARIEAEPLVPARWRGDPPPGEGDARATGVLSRVASAPIWLHQTFISPQDGDRCVFTPSCSEYAALALKARGLAGWPIASDRILRCHHGAHDRRGAEHGITSDPFPSSRTRLSVGGAAASLAPGLGQWIGGDRADAVYALATVGVLAWGASHYARQGRDAPAAALGSLGVFFYVGNIYGGARAVDASPSPR